MREFDLDLGKTIELCRAYEQSVESTKEMNKGAFATKDHNLDKVLRLDNSFKSGTEFLTPSKGTETQGRQGIK